ncbi:hypothetical protein BRCON_1941 [Candidatus Sumerlaea chitinivorans]|jgi:hypothetical protein|uniref:Glycosyltransferase RgtA/B/C/D-like domain-containing protein n=1 Tax=Sumerlaea chitinivorans TaxID=2250252 RepID=A0A2Z4Y7A3_SUMC1|nr:hypothetical protein BRCON_1941 [Candidatus Sumerlaea chitinivorans]
MPKLSRLTDFARSFGAFVARLVQQCTAAWAWLRRAPVPLLVGVACFLIYLYKPLIQSSMDNQPLRFGAALLATRGTLDFTELNIGLDRFYSFRVMPDGKVRAHTPVGAALLGAPFFWIARQLGMELTDENVVFLDSLAASVLTAASAAMLSFLARRYRRRTALFLGFTLALATASWSTASRCLWQHTGAQFSMLAALCLLDRERRHPVAFLFGGLLLAYTFWCRPALAPVIAVIAVGALIRTRRELLLGGAAALLAVGAWVAFNMATSGKPLGTYVSLRALGPETWSAYPRRLFGTLFSPNRGMFVFSPILLLAMVALPRNLAHWRTERWRAALALAALVGILMRGFFYGWFGGHCYGSRYMLDVAALLLLGAAPLFDFLLANWRRAVLPIALFGLSAFIQWLGVARDYESWNILMGMTRETNAWNWRKSQILHCLTYGASTREPLAVSSAVNLPPNGVIRLKDDPTSPFLRYGFVYQEPHGNWAMPPRAGIAFNLSAPSALRLRVEVTSEYFPYEPTTVGLYLNGTKFGEIVILAKDFTFAQAPWFDVPAKLTKEGLNLLELRVSRVYYPYASPAPVGAAIRDVIVLPVGKK